MIVLVSFRILRAIQMLQGNSYLTGGIGAENLRIVTPAGVSGGVRSRPAQAPKAGYGGRNLVTVRAEAFKVRWLSAEFSLFVSVGAFTSAMPVAVPWLRISGLDQKPVCLSHGMQVVQAPQFEQLQHA